MSKTTFIDGNPSQSILGTIVTAAFLTALNNQRHTGLDVDGAGALDYAVSTGSANAYVVTLTPALAAYVAGMPIIFKASFANTGAATLAVNGGAATALRKRLNVALVANDIVVDQIVVAIYDGTYFQVISLGGGNTYASAAEITAGTEAAKTIAPDQAVLALMKKTGANLAIGSDADGDMYYRAASVLARLAKGGADAKMFMNAAGTLPEWAAGIYVGSFTRVLSTASGNVAYTGIGFKPRVLIQLGGLSGGGVGVGLGDIAKQAAITDGGYMVPSFIYIENSGAQRADIISFEADGFTLAWVKIGSPTATITIYFIASR
jgi:hypothetical protein